MWNGDNHLTQPNIHKSEDRANIEIDITDDHEWVERIAKTANEICDDPDNNCIKLNGQHNGLISLMMLERWDVSAGQPST